MLEHALPAQAGVGVFAGRRCGRRFFRRTLVADIHERINAPGRERDDTRILECFGDDCGHMNVHGPGQIEIIRRAELAARHEDDVGDARQARHGFAVEQIGRDGLDAPAFELFGQFGIGKPGNADHAFFGRRALGETRQRWAHLAADAQHHDIALDRRQIADQVFGRQTHEVVERSRIGKPRGQCGPHQP